MPCRQSLQLRSSQSKELLTSNKGIPMQFWGDMREEIMRRSIDARNWLPGSRSSASMSNNQPPDVRASFDVGQLNIPNQQSPDPTQA